MTTQRFKSLPRRSLAESIADRLIQMILNGELQPGEQLPPERELATMLSVSRPSLREALRMLAQRNIIDRQHGRGTYVSSLEPKLLIESFDYLLSLQSVSMAQILETRRLVEVGAAGLAAERATDAELQALTHLVAEMGGLCANADLFLEADIRLHRLIAEATHNPLLNRVVTSLLYLNYADGDMRTRQASIIPQIHTDHLALVAALEQRNSAAACAAMERHIQTLIATLNGDPADGRKERALSG